MQWEGGIMIPKNCPCWYPQKSEEEEVRTNVLGGKELNKASPKTDYGDRLAFRWGSNANAGAGWLPLRGWYVLGSRGVQSSMRANEESGI